MGSHEVASRTKVGMIPYARRSTGATNGSHYMSSMAAGTPNTGRDMLVLYDPKYNEYNWGGVRGKLRVM